jgi:hypothetical protein
MAKRRKSEVEEQVQDQQAVASNAAAVVAPEASVASDATAVTSDATAVAVGVVPVTEDKVVPLVVSPKEGAASKNSSYPFEDDQLYADYFREDKENGRLNRTVFFPLKTAKRLSQAVDAPVSRLASYLLFGDDGAVRRCDNPNCGRNFQPQWGVVMPADMLTKVVNLRLGRANDDDRDQVDRFHHATLGGFREIGFELDESLPEEELLPYLQLMAVYHDPTNNWAPTEVPKINGSHAINADGELKSYCGAYFWSRLVERTNPKTGQKYLDRVPERADPAKSCLTWALAQLEDGIDNVCREHQIERRDPFEAYSCASFVSKYAAAEQATRIANIEKSLLQRAQGEQEMRGQLGLAGLSRRFQQAAEGKSSGQQGGQRPPLSGGLGGLKMISGKIQYQEGNASAPSRGDKRRFQGGR